MSRKLLPQDVEVVRTFDALGLKENLLRGVYAYGHLASPRWIKTRNTMKPLHVHQLVQSMRPH